MMLLLGHPSSTLVLDDEWGLMFYLRIYKMRTSLTHSSGVLQGTDCTFPEPLPC